VPTPIPGWGTGRIKSVCRELEAVRLVFLWSPTRLEHNGGLSAKMGLSPNSKETKIMVWKKTKQLKKEAMI
jgi:hypothetical protein